MDDATTHVSAFFTPADVGRRGRWSRRSAARRRSSDARGSVVAARRESLRAEREKAAEAGYLPAGGEGGTDALRSMRRLRLPSHRATSEVLAGAYPFLAEAGLGSDGVFIGQDAWSGGGFCFDPWVLYAQGVITNPNCLLAGVLGKGKSCLAKSLATRSIAFGRRVYVPGDPKGEWTAVAKAVGGQAASSEAGTRTASTRWTQVHATPARATKRGQPRCGPDGGFCSDRWLSRRSRDRCGRWSTRHWTRR